MRYFITASVLVAGALAQSTDDYLKCARAALDTIDPSTFTTCTDKTSKECFCANKSALETLTTSTVPACEGLDLSTISSTLCPSDGEAAPARHASKPMMLADKRAYAPEPAPRVVYVTKTHTDCSCKSTPVVEKPLHVSQIPVNVPASSSLASVAAASSTPADREHGLMGGAASSSVVFGPQASGATPSARPSGVDPTRFSPFQGAAAVGASVNGGVAALGVAAVMAVMVAL
ncbi:hypothetical protein N7536_009810 [Penicillium majusculum]|uniref:Extracellular membrane protein CFEM domain-containing protein n=1 Tax=Penicillium solitum TaxID=60172 RepID=A0A1V6QUA0_9EURO|nr:uncharacterized protein PENSOL_c037G07927 [Penicillium solitum]KAJ5687191.1 hypothetical protein N7536_009810 [Penicillium majusculum]OQD92803.1 hypothetical protein PENSOL_c037G07927 [Penicillium solitum]